MKTFTPVLFLLLGAMTSHATVFTVNSLAITNTGSGNSGTLYYCISQANLSAGPHVINFSVSGTIPINAPSGLLPAVTQAVTIDGTTAPGYAGTPVVIVDGTGLVNGAGLTVNAAGFRLYGMDINRFPYWGVQVNGDASDDFIIGAAGKGNVIRNNGYYGIQINSADNGKIAYNKIGVDPTGTACAPNLYDGIDLQSGSNGDSILFNQVSCNGYNGIQIGASNNTVIRGNLIGPLLNQCTGSGYRGIDIEGGSTGNIVGGPNPSDFNKIAGNLYWGVQVKDNGTINNTLQGNSYSCNDYGAIDVTTGGNNGIAPPVISTANTSMITGTAVPNAVIEIFKAMQTVSTLCPTMPQNQGVDYIGSVTANGTGNWSMSGSFSGYVTATQRDGSGNSSEFFTSVYTGTPGTLTNNCSGNVITGMDAMEKDLIYIWPNPATDLVYVQSGKHPEARVILYDMHGREILVTGCYDNGGVCELGLGSLPPGIYYMYVSAGGRVQTDKLVILR